MKLPIINEQDQKASKAKLEKYYSGDLIPPEKKEYLTVLSKSQGPYLAIEGADGQTKYLMDAASQIATLGMGFSPSAFMGTAHLLESWLNLDNSEVVKNIDKAFKSFIKRKTNWEHLEVTFVNSGAEANETALGYCYKRRKNAKAKRVIAFENSFHGRMMVTLAATWNKSKREPFEWPGYEINYIPFPELPDSNINLQSPQGWKELWSNATSKQFKIPSTYSNDPVLENEVKTLTKVRDSLLTKEFFAIIIEPMQCEGGDCYSSSRFNNALLLMSKAFEVPLIFDEVQTGFHLGREFFWHTQFNLKNCDGSPLLPDFVTCAKKAQVGMVISPNHLFKTEFERKEEFQVASLSRGYIHALALDQAQAKIIQLEKMTMAKLETLVNKHSNHLARPRAMGLSFAFDLKDKSKLNDFVNKRFDHGLLYYPAGDKTLRFRLNTSFNTQDLDFLFQELDHITDELFNNAPVKLPAYAETAERNISESYQWQETLLKGKLASLQAETLSTDQLVKEMNQLFEKNNLQLVIIDKNNFNEFRSKIVKMQQEHYEPARQTKIEKFEDAVNHSSSVCISLLKENEIEAMAFASPLKINPTERGVRRDPHFEDEKVLYMLDVTVNNKAQGHGLGKLVKYAVSLLAQSKGMKKIHGRNRDRLAAPMLNINLSLGGHELFYIAEDYLDNEAHRDVLYYTSPLKWNEPELHFANGTTSPITTRSLNFGYIKDQLPYLVNKICLSNFVSTRFLDQVSGLYNLITSDLRHGYICSGQSEAVDKIAKSLWYVSSKKTYKMITFDGHYFGNGSFLARSLSNKEDKFFPVVHLNNPTQSNYKEVLKELEKTLKEDQFLAVWLEPLTQNEMHKVPNDFIIEAKKLCKSFGASLVFNETASSRFAYDENHYFVCNNDQLSPDMGMVFVGGQAAMVYSKPEKFINKPLMLISTWDGDEFSFATYYQQAKNVSKDIEAFKQTCKLFESKLKSKIQDFELTDWSFQNGKGRFKANLPFELRKKFKRKGEFYIIDASYDSMIDALESELK